MQTTDLTYPFAQAPEAAQCTEVAPGIRWLRLALPWSLDHINLWLLDDGPGRCAVVDTGLGDAHSRQIWATLLASQAAALSQIVVTHYHPDHIGNAAWLAQRTGAPVYMASSEYLLAQALFHQNTGCDVAAMIAHFRHHGLDEARLARLAARGNVFRRGVPELPGAYQRLLDGDSLRIGEYTWQCIVGQGHSPEHISLYSAQAGVLISGDMVLPRITPNISVPPAAPDEDSVGRYLVSLARFDALPGDTLVLPAHGLPFRGLHARIGQMHTHHTRRDATMCAALATPGCAAELLSTLFHRALDAHQVMFAMSETIAHLNHLWRRGLVHRVEEQGLLRYQAVS